MSSYPPDIQEAYNVFAVRCSRCHTLARPLNARIDDPQHWVRYVARMRLTPGSGITAKNGDVILRFLLYYMKERGLQSSGGDETDFPEDAPSEPAAEGTDSSGLSQPSAAMPAAGSERSAAGVSLDTEIDDGENVDEKRMPMRQSSAPETDP